jgi:hypothetical protein
VPAPFQAGAQTGLGSHHRSQQKIILQHQGGRRAPVIPVRPELKMLRDLDCKKPKLSLIMLTPLLMVPVLQKRHARVEPVRRGLLPPAHHDYHHQGPAPTPWKEKHAPARSAWVNLTEQTRVNFVERHSPRLTTIRELVLYAFTFPPGRRGNVGRRNAVRCRQ